MRIALLGPPGAGKGTQAKMLAKRIKLAHISTGDILRQNVTSGTDLGKKAKDYMEQGALVPDELVTQMLIKRLDEPDARKGFILDGYPRNIRQAEALDDILKKRSMASIDLAVYLYSSEPVIIQRLTGRRVCRNCGANYHIKNMPPKVQMVCDHCGGQLYQRQDDKEETIKKRLQVYRQEVSGLLDYYESRKKLQRVCADEDLELVLNKIIEMTRQYDDSAKVK